MTPSGDTMSTTQQMIEYRLRELISDTTRRIEAEMVPACPTSEFLVALATEVNSAMTAPDSVPYPNLVDPEAYWVASVRPQAAALRSAVDEILSWLESGVVSIMGVAEADLKATIDAAAAAGVAEPTTARASLEQEMGRRCLELHHLMAEILTVTPSRGTLHRSRESFEDRLRCQAVEDVDGLKAAYLQAAGGDEAHQRFAEQQWSETHADRVEYREALLRAEPPWRHLELAIIGHERACDSVEQSVERVVNRLQAPLVDMSGLLMDRFDSVEFD